MSEISEYGLPKGGTRWTAPVEDVVRVLDESGYGEVWDQRDPSSDWWAADLPNGRRVHFQGASGMMGGYRLTICETDGAGDWTIGKVILDMNGFGDPATLFCEAMDIPNSPEVLSLSGYDPSDFIGAYKVLTKESA